MKRAKRWIIGLVIVLALLLVALYYMAPGMILYPYRANVNTTPAQYQLPFEAVTVTAVDGAVLQGVWVRHDSVAKRPVIILLHGVGNCKERWYSTAQWLWQAGYSTLMMDSRAHGQSGGKYCTYGYFEKKDVAKVLDYIAARDSALHVGAWGHSLGGAIALQAMEYDRRIDFGIVESTFATFRDVVFDYQKRLFKLSWRSFADHSIQRAAEIGGFEPDSIQPCLSAKHIQCPVFLAHGTQDERISVKYAHLNYANLATPHKQFYPVTGAHHNDLSAHGGKAYQQAILDFLKQYH